MNISDYHIRIANIDDIAIIAKHDTHISEVLIADKVTRGEIVVVYDGNKFIGWLRYGLFWDIVPFMNMLEILPEYQGKGLGRKLVEFWHSEMQAKGCTIVMTATQQNENAQHFYNALGYVGVGGFVQSVGVVTGESYEVMMMKEL